MLLGGLAALSSSCTWLGLHPGSEVEDTPEPSVIAMYASSPRSAVMGGCGTRGGFDFAFNAHWGPRLAPGPSRRDERV